MSVGCDGLGDAEGAADGLGDAEGAADGLGEAAGLGEGDGLGLGDPDGGGSGVEVPSEVLTTVWKGRSKRGFPSGAHPLFSLAKYHASPRG